LGYFALNFVLHIISAEKVIFYILTQNHLPFPEKRETCPSVAEAEVSKSCGYLSGHLRWGKKIG
jgi:hypothetical protein